MAEKLQFTTSAKVVKDSELPAINFTLDDREFVAYPPSGAELALLFGAMDDMDPDDAETVEPEHIGVLMDFFLDRLNHADRIFIKRRLKNRRDPLDLDSIESIFLKLVKAWSGHPTESSSGSTPPPEPIGPTSSESTAISI